MLSKHSLVSQNVIRAINFERSQFQLTTTGFEHSSSDPKSDALSIRPRDFCLTVDWSLYFLRKCIIHPQINTLMNSTKN